RKRNNVDVFYDGDTFPFPDNSFDSILATEVLENVFNPDVFLSEVHRVLKKKTGILFLSCPLMWMEHQQPYDYGRYTSFGIVHILKKQAFEILWQGKTVSGAAAIFQLIASYLRTKIRVKNYYLQIFLYSLFISPATILGIVASRFSSQQGSPVFIGSVVLAKSV
ncbi:methyltransferase domain-containing protein, partial [Patescibacteria group bacterium]|nr:methyltransferase domain-containing protein [Patescibacteria group bacterium]